MTTSDQGAELSPLKRAIVEIRALKERVSTLERTENEPVALIGVGLRLPGAVNTPDDFWRLLVAGGDAVGPIPPERWDVEAFYAAHPQLPGKMLTRHGAFLDAIDQFAPAFFNIAPREAEQMDPQQRLLLQVAWEALEHAGQAPERLDGSATGVFLGICNSDYGRMLAADTDAIDVYLATGNAPSVAAGRLSYLLGLRGPSLAIDTACSSSLVATHLAVRSLRSRECDLALVGGVNLILTPEYNIAFSKAGMLAADGRCKTFDANADGYVRGEGCAVVVLKRLGDALADDDQIIAVIRGSAVNQDGRSGGLTAPNGPAQEAVIRAALADARLKPDDVGYVEAHGTGTSLGDPIEVQALGATLGVGRSRGQPLLIGSVKTNLGHLEAAAGVVGLIKAALMLQHRQIVPHLHLQTPNPHIAWQQLAIQVPTQLQLWAASDRRVAGVSSFGFSGTNAHIMLQEAPLVDDSGQETGDRGPEAIGCSGDRPLHLVCLSARSEGALRALAERYAAHLEANREQALADVAFSANSGRSHFEHRLAAVVPDHTSLRRQLAAFVAGQNTDLLLGRTNAGAVPEVVFLFTGHGAHYAGMGRALYETQPVFRAAIERCDALLRAEVDCTLSTILFGDDDRLSQLVYVQPALFALQYALAELWQSWGLRPAAVAGHSAGEYVAAVVAGVLSLEDGLRLIAARGRLLQSLPADGAMIAIFADEGTVAAAIEPYAAYVGIAAINGPATTVISGRQDAVQAVVDALALEADDYRRLAVGVAAHSPLVEPILTPFAQIVATVPLRAPQIGLLSSLTGTFVTQEITTATYWRQHVREPVRFAAVFDTLRAAGYDTFVEIGPHPTLVKLGQRCWPDASASWLPSLHRDRDAWAQLLESLATLYTRGIAVDWHGFDTPYRRRRVRLPAYPWENARYWSASAAPRALRQQSDVERQVSHAQAHRNTFHAQRTGPNALSTTWSAMVTAAQLQAAQGPFDLYADRYSGRWQLLNALADAYIVRALRSLNLFAQAGEAHTVSELIARFGITTTYAPLLARWLDGLAAQGVLHTDAAGVYCADTPLPTVDIDVLLAQAETVFAEVRPLLDYVWRCGEHLTVVLLGEESALNTLFPDGSYETVDFMYNSWAVARYFNGIVRAAVWTSGQVQPDRPLRVLEIGAGSGGTTATLLPALPPDRTEYHFTDVSDFFLARAAERWAAYPFVQYRTLNIEEPPLDQGYAAHSYDLVVAANVLHATSDLDATLRHVAELLAPGGALVLYETTSHPRWFDITTGLIEGWHRFADSWRGDNPLLDVETWERALQQAGFEITLAVPENAQPTAIFGQHVILARAPLHSSIVDVRTNEPQQLARHNTPRAALVPDAAPAWSIVGLHAALPDERRDLLIDYVRHAIGRVLRIADVSALQREQPLLALGFDSLMAVELRNVLRQGLELPRNLPATLVFDYPSIAAIAAFLEQHLFDVPSAPSLAPSEPTAQVSKSAEHIAALSDEEVEMLLLQRLAELE
jgi:acyl transferase domain-containing protein/SAM-dependent methyltransferase